MSQDPSVPTPAELSKALLEADIRRTRERVARDVTALKSQLDLESLKGRAMGVAERSVESMALQVTRRVAKFPRALLEAGREHPVAAGALGLGLILVLWRAGRRR